MNYTKIKILHLIEHMNIGGAEKQAYYIIKNLDPFKYQITVGCLREMGTLGKQLLKDGFEVVEFRKKKKLDLMCLVRLVRFMRTHQFDIVHMHLFTANLWGTIAAKLARIKHTISHEHSLFVLNNKLFVTVKNMCLFFNSITIAVSDDIRYKLNKRVFKFHKNKIHKIYNGIPLLTPSSSSFTKADLGILKSTYLIGMVGRLEPRKDFFTLLEAVHELKNDHDIHLMLIGDGELKSPLKKYADFLGLKDIVSFMGERKDVIHILTALDLFVLSSYTEGIPISVLEAMAMRRPVVASDVGGLKEIISSRINGILVRPQDMTHLKQSIEFMIKNKEEAKKFSDAGFEKFKSSFSIQKNISALDHLYQKLYLGEMTTSF